MQKRFVLVAVALLAVCACAPLRVPAPADASAPRFTSSGGINRAEHLGKPHLVLVSFDGFRADYLDRFDLPNFRRVQARGTRARAMRPVFPSMTFPNHYSLVTGLYPGRHGIVGNSFYDPARRERYSIGNPATVQDGTWYRGEPIWVTAESQGMVAGCFFWPGSEAEIMGVRPTHWQPFDEKVPNDTRVSTVIEWLRLPALRRPHLITLYFNELDSASHRSALDSPNIEAAARSLDRSLGLLLDGIESLPHRDRVALLLTSDHGMVDTSVSHTVNLSTLIDASKIEAAYGGPVASLHLSGGPAVARATRDAINARLEHGRAYLRQDVPNEHHFRADPRAGDVVIIMEESWTLATSNRTPSRADSWGAHGWDPGLPSMGALFVAAGPGIRAGATIGEVRNVDVYPLMTELLGLRPAAGVDGAAGRIRRQIVQ